MSNSFKWLAVLLISLTSTVAANAQCKNIDVSAEHVNTSANISNGSIKIDFKNLDKNDFEINVFGPNKKNTLKSDKTEFNNLTKGKYLIIIVSKREQDNICPKSINLTIN